MTRIILDLCGGTGSWSRPWKEAGYDVRNITLPEYDVLTYIPPKEVYGILAAPPLYGIFGIKLRSCTERAGRKKRHGDRERLLPDYRDVQVEILGDGKSARTPAEVSWKTEADVSAVVVRRSVDKMHGYLG